MFLLLFQLTVIFDFFYLIVIRFTSTFTKDRTCKGVSPIEDACLYVYQICFCFISIYSFLLHLCLFLDYFAA